jgi:hypothetical protein
MAGILANAASKTMVAGDTAADKSVSGYITAESITLTTNPTGTTYSWGLSKPAGSTARAALSDDDGASVNITPDVEGTYLVTCVVDGSTTYVIRIGCVNISVVSSLGALRFTPIANSQVPTPAAGRTVYFSSDSSALVEKRPDGTVHVITVV